MPLSVSEAVNNKFVRLYDKDGKDLPPSSPAYDQRRRSSYDLRPRWIIKDGIEYDLEAPDHKKQLDDLRFPPQGALTLVSRERIVLPETHVAYAFLRTGLARKGLLAINTGIVDGGWDNHVATILINFGRDELTVGHIRDEAFLRLTFHKVEGGGGTVPDIMSPETYREARIRESNVFPSTFLDVPRSIDRMEEKISTKAVKSVWVNLGYLAAGLSILLVLMSAALPPIVNWASRLGSSEAPLPSAQLQIAELRERVAILESQREATGLVQGTAQGYPIREPAQVGRGRANADSTASTRRP